MDIGTLSSFISTLGFPIVCVIGLAWFVNKQLEASNENQNKALDRITQKCQEREDKLYEALKECRDINSKAVATIGMYAEKIGNIQKDIADIKTDIEIIKSK